MAKMIKMKSTAEDGFEFGALHHAAQGGAAAAASS